MQPRKIPFSIAFCVLMWSASQVQAWGWIQPSPSFTAAQTAVRSTPSIQTILSRGNCIYGDVSCRDGKKCIPTSWVCDRWPDCPDWSDEVYCRNSSMRSSINPFPTSSVQAKQSVDVSSGVVRLVGGSYNAGRVEVYYQGQWGTVCDDSWDINDARVICRLLGFQHAKTAYKGGHFPDGSGQIWLDDVQCGGYELSLFSCGHSGWGNHNCGHGEDAGVRCGSAGGGVVVDPQCCQLGEKVDAGTCQARAMNFSISNESSSFYPRDDCVIQFYKCCYKRFEMDVRQRSGNVDVPNNLLNGLGLDQDP